MREHGGAVVTDVMEVMESGHMAFASDPSGAVFGLWQPRDMHGFGVVDESGAYAWAELTTTRVDGCTAFYRDVFGWGSESGEDEAMDYTEFQLGVTSIAGVMAMPETMPADHPSSWGVYFQVDDTDEAVARAAGLGDLRGSGPWTSRRGGSRSWSTPREHRSVSLRSARPDPGCQPAARRAECRNRGHGRGPNDSPLVLPRLSS